jgi:ribosomal protein S18 acetylase RimI-like enzyme
MRFIKRDINCVKNHLITVILLYNDITIGYAHIDHEDKYWFGICILNEYQGKGFGKLLMEYLFEHEKIKQISNIYLTVDKINEPAIKLYKKYNFNIIEEHETYYLMVKDM